MSSHRQETATARNTALARIAPTTKLLHFVLNHLHQHTHTHKQNCMYREPRGCKCVLNAPSRWCRTGTLSPADAPRLLAPPTGDSLTSTVLGCTVRWPSTRSPHTKEEAQDDMVLSASREQKHEHVNGFTN